MEKVTRMTSVVQQAVEDSVEAVFGVDQELADRVIEADRRIDEDEVEIEKQAIELLALHHPAASDLRLVATIIKANSDFERIADCAVNIAQRVQFLKNVDRYKPPKELRMLAGSVIETLRETIKAFRTTDEPKAREVLKADDVIDALYHHFIQDMLGIMESDEHKANRDLSNVMIAKNLERIADHCTNIAEDVIYVRSGQIIRHLHTA